MLWDVKRSRCLMPWIIIPPILLVIDFWGLSDKNKIRNFVLRVRCGILGDDCLIYIYLRHILAFIQSVMTISRIIHGKQQYLVSISFVSYDQRDKMTTSKQFATLQKTFYKINHHTAY